MARPKARFLGAEPPTIATVREGTRQVIANFIGRHANGRDEDFADLIEEIAAAAWLARQCVLMADDDTSAQDVRAELSVMLEWISNGDIHRLTENWPKLSADVANALRCHAALDPFEKGNFYETTNLREALMAVLDGYTVAKRRPRDTDHSAAIELARRIDAALTPYADSLRASTSIYANSYTTQAGSGQSSLIELLQAVGESVGLKFSMAGWRDILSKVRRAECKLSRGGFAD